MTHLKRLSLLIAALLLTLTLASCRNETQNQIRRNLQDFTNQRMYITLYSLDGTPVYESVVDGKVTRASDALASEDGTAAGGYIFWYDDHGRYHQTDLPYLVTTFDRSEEAEELP